MIYIACDQSAQDLLTKAEKNGSLNLEGDTDDEDRGELIIKILNIVPEDPNMTVFLVK